MRGSDREYRHSVGQRGPEDSLPEAAPAASMAAFGGLASARPQCACCQRVPAPAGSHQTPVMALSRSRTERSEK